MSDYRPLHDGWTVRAIPARNGSGEPPAHLTRPVPASVPGCVHTDLLAAGLIPDPFVDGNEHHLSWIGHLDWTYQTEFDWPDTGRKFDWPDTGRVAGPAGGRDGSAEGRGHPAADGAAGVQRVDLVCDGLDTVATVTLNDTELGRTQNMHRGYRFPVEHALRPGRNVLRVDFGSAHRYIERMITLVGDRPRAYPAAFNLIRKMACNFGWDWGPSLVTAGIWRPVGLHSWHTARLARVRPLVTVEGDTGVVRVEVDLERARPDGAPVEVTAQVLGRHAAVPVPAGDRHATVHLRVPDAPLWWPRGYGEQPLAPLRISLIRGGEELDTWQRRIGFRSVRLDTTPDEHGTPFTVVVNDRPVMVRGVNWIPDDPFPSRVTARRYAERLDQAVGANVNYLRVWGGGRYESDDFYDAADERGLLVGQDFLFACAAYPEEEPFASEVRAEAQDNVVRLASHPSLVLWTGNNENVWGYHDWGWPEELAGRSWGAGYYHDLLPGIVTRLDPTRPYWPASPYSGSPDRHPNDPHHGTSHEWNVWNRIDYTHYRDYVPRFVAEFGYQAPATYATLRRYLSDEPLTPDGPGIGWHQKAEDGDAKLRRGLAAHLPDPRDFADWHYLTQLNQARAIRVAIGHYRSHQPVCSGSIVWQLNDCWPAISWSAVDSDGRRKPLWYELRRLYADRLLTIQPRGDDLVLAAVNDSDRPWTGMVSAVRHRLTGEALATQAVAVDVPPRSVVRVPIAPELARPGEASSELLRATFGDERAWWFFAEDREIAYPKARHATEVRPVTGGVAVTVTADTILRDLILYPDRLDPAAEVDEALVTLLPGESVTFTVHSGQALDGDALTRAPVLRCVNDVTP